jgi:hypothetical protein
VQLLHFEHSGCATLGDSPYADTTSLALLNVLWDSIAKNLDKHESIAAAFPPAALAQLRAASVSTLIAFTRTVADARGVDASSKSQNLRTVGDHQPRTARTRLRADRFNLLSIVPETVGSASKAQLETQLV